MTSATKQKKSAQAHGLDHLIPEKKFAETYISRDIAGLQDLKVLRYARKCEPPKNVMFHGPTGPGKTSLILAYCATDEIPLVTIQCDGGIDPNNFWGGLTFGEAMPDGSQSVVWQWSEVTQIIRYGGVLYFDEVNFLHPKVSATFHGLLDKRRQITVAERGNEVIKAHPDLQIVTAYNPDYEGVRPLNAAFKNRFTIKVEMDYDEGVEKQLVYMPKMLEIAHKLRLQYKAGVIETPISTNMLIEFEELAIDLGYAFATENFLAAFSADERSAVQEAWSLNEDDIKDQLAELMSDD